MEVEAPTTFIGKTLQEITLRNKYDLDLLLIRRSEGKKTVYIHPGGKTKIKMNDVLLVFGPQE